MMKTKQKRKTKTSSDESERITKVFSTIGGKPKRKRRTKAQMEAARAKEAKAQAEKDFKIPQNAQSDSFSKVYDRPQKSDKPFVPSKKYPKPPPAPKFDETLIYEKLIFPGGMVYAKGKSSADNFHLMYLNSIDNSWNILYNGRYNDTNQHWNHLVKIKKDVEDRNDESRNANAKKSTPNSKRSSKTSVKSRKVSSKVRKG